MKKVIHVEATVPWAARRTGSGNWIGVCNPLGLTLQSATYATLMEDIGQALNAIMLDLLATNDLNRFLRDQGWHLAGTIPPETKNLIFDVPFIPSIIPPDGPQANIHQ